MLLLNYITFFLNTILNFVPLPPSEFLSRMYTFLQRVFYLYHTQLNVALKEEGNL